jgi:hypothetical protein
LAGKKVDADGDVLDKHGNVLGKAERYEEEEAVPEPEPEAEDVSILEGKKVNKVSLRTQILFHSLINFNI